MEPCRCRLATFWVCSSYDVAQTSYGEVIRCRFVKPLGVREKCIVQKWVNCWSNSHTNHTSKFLQILQKNGQGPPMLPLHVFALMRNDRARKSQVSSWCTTKWKDLSKQWTMSIFLKHGSRTTCWSLRFEFYIWFEKQWFYVWHQTSRQEWMWWDVHAEVSKRTGLLKYRGITGHRPWYQLLNRSRDCHTTWGMKTCLKVIPLSRIWLTVSQRITADRFHYTRTVQIWWKVIWWSVGFMIPMVRM